MTAPIVFKAVANVGVPLDLFGRLCAAVTGGLVASPIPDEGYLIQPSDVSSYTIKTIVNGVQVGPTITAGITFYNTIQTGGLWSGGTLGSVGGNAKYAVPGSTFTTVGQTVRIQIAILLTDGTSIVPWITDVAIQIPLM